MVAPIIYSKASLEQQAILQNQYEIVPFAINTIRLECIFVDKVFASEFYYQRNEYFDVSKHIYDLAVMACHDEVQKLLAEPAEMTAMMAFKRREESSRIGSELSDKSISDFKIFQDAKDNKVLRDKFKTMQDIYIFDESDKIPFQDAASSLSDIQSSLLNELLAN